MRGIITAVARFYWEGFRAMRLGRVLWAIILLKLVILFGVVKPFFMPGFLETRFHDDERAKAAYVLERLTAVAPVGGDRSGQPANPSIRR